MKVIEFYFDLVSPYSYIGYHRILKVAEQYNAEIIWKPMFLVDVLKETGNRTALEIPAKAHYSLKDLGRWAKLWSIPIKISPYFPMNTLYLMRLLIAIQLFASEKFEPVLSLLFDAMFQHPKNLTDLKIVVDLLSHLDLDEKQIQTWLDDEKVKAELKYVTNEAVEKGVFGAPTWFVNDEMFWGVSHLCFVEYALQSSGSD